MDRIEFPGWRIEYDRAATVEMLARMPMGGAEACGCDACRNWAATRRVILSRPFQSLLEELGIPLDREIEVYHCGKLESGQHLYGGWYHFVGQVLEFPQLLYFAVFFAAYIAMLLTGLLQSQ